jgi:hypothetical protein
VGFPIRRFTDQSPFAAPRDLSQRTTSFIASQRQGIHRIPLRHLIALIAKTRSRASEDRGRTAKDGKRLSIPACRSAPLSDSILAIEKTSFASNASGNPGGQPHGPTTGCLTDGTGRTTEDRHIRLPISAERHPITECASSSRCQISRDGGWTRENRVLPPTFPASQTPKRLSRSTKLIFRIGRAGSSQGGEPARTELISVIGRPKLVEPDGIEPTTSCLQSTRSPN